MLQNFLKIRNRIFFWNTIEKILISKNQNNFTKITISTTDGNVMTYQDRESTDIANTVITLISDNFNTDNNRISQNGKFIKIKNEIWNLEFLKEVRQIVKRAGNKELYLHFKNSTRIIRGNDEVEDILDLLQIENLTSVENILTEQNNNAGVDYDYIQSLINLSQTEFANTWGNQIALLVQEINDFKGSFNYNLVNFPIVMPYQQYNGRDVYIIIYDIDIPSDKISHSIEIPNSTLFIKFIKIELFNRNQFGDTIKLQTVGSFSSIIEFSGNDDDGIGGSSNTIKAGKIYGIVEYTLE